MKKRIAGILFGIFFVCFTASIIASLITGVKLILAATTGTTVTDNKTLPVQFVDENWVKYGNKTIDNKMRVVNSPYFMEISKRSIPAHIPIRVLGRNSSLPLNTFTDFSALGVTIIPLPASAISMEVVSDDAEDTGTSGTGAWEVEIHGLGDGYIAQNEEIILNGTTAVATVNDYIRINAMHVTAAGSTGFNEGDITIQATGAGTAYNRIVALDNASFQGLYTVPINKVAFIVSASAGVLAREAEVQLMINLDSWDEHGKIPIFIPHGMNILKDTSQSVSFQFPLRVPATVDIKFRGKVTSGTAGIGVANMEIFIEDE